MNGVKLIINDLLILSKKDEIIFLTIGIITIILLTILFIYKEISKKEGG